MKIRQKITSPIFTPAEISNLKNKNPIKEFIIKVNTTKIFLPHFLNLNKPIIDTINNIDNRKTVTINTSQKNACAGMINIINRIKAANRSIIMPNIDNE